eukprot:365686-Chlamydomonas_euryale.AAC.7
MPTDEGRRGRGGRGAEGGGSRSIASMRVLALNVKPMLMDHGRGVQLAGHACRTAVACRVCQLA